MEKDSIPLDDREFIRNWNTGKVYIILIVKIVAELETDRHPTSSLYNNQAIIEKMQRFKNMLTDNKNINFGAIRKKYFAKYKMEVSDIARLQSILFIKK